MSFINILKEIAKVAITVEGVAAPIAEGLLPGFAPVIAEVDSIFQKLQSAVVTVEAQNPIDGAGQLKATVVASDFASSIDVVNAFLATEGKKSSYDATALQAAISSQVAAYNAMSILKASFKIVPM